MTDISKLLREAATYVGPCGDTELVEKLLAAAESLGEPVAWLWDGVGERAVTLDTDEADGMWKPLYLAPQPAVREWRPIESYDAMSTKPKALFYVAAKPNAARPYLNLSAAISTERHMGSRTITHWMPLPEPPAGDSHHE